MTTQDKGADAEIARLRKENEAFRWALIEMMWVTAQQYTDEKNWTIMLYTDNEECARAFAVLGWPNPCPKDQAK